MATNDPWKRYLDAGFELTQLTRQRAEKLVRDLIKNGEVQRDEAQERVEELLERSRKVTESIVELVRDEVSKQLKALGLNSRRAGGGSRSSSPGAATNKAASGAKKTASSATKTTAAKTAPAAKKAGTAAKKTGAATKKAGGAAKKATGAS